MGFMKPIFFGLIGAILVAAAVGVLAWKVVLPKKAVVTSTEAAAAEQQRIADQRPAQEKALAEAKHRWEVAHDSIALLMDERSIPISMGQPVITMTNLWQEVREDLPPLVEKLIRDSGCVLVQGASGWAPRMTPFESSTAWIELPIGHAASGPTSIAQSGSDVLWVAGTLADIERLYKSLRNFPRILTIQHLALVRLRELAGTQMYQTVSEMLDRDEEEVLLAPISLSIWLMCETPEAPAAAAAAAGGAPGGGMGGGMPGGGMGGGMPGEMGGGMPGGGAGGMPGGGAPPGAAPGGGAPPGAPPGAGAGGGGKAGGGGDEA